MTDKPTSRRERRRQEIRARISDAALSLFSEKGCQEATVEEICELADVARKTFYNYYPSKQELLNELSQLLLVDETVNLLELALEKHPDTRTRLKFIFSSINEAMTNFQSLERSLITQSLVDLHSQFGRSGEQLETLNDAYHKLYLQAHKDGELKDEHDPLFYAEMTVGLINATTLNWVHNEEYPLLKRNEQNCEFLIEHVLV